MTEKIIDLFQNIAKPFKDNEGGEKLEIMRQWLSSRDIQNEYINGLGLVANQQDQPRVILMTHMDLINKFQKGFAENNICTLTETSIIGALDNTITNSCALLALEELLSNDITDVEVIFTEGEEVGLTGAREYLKAFKAKSTNAFFINLDVTSDGWKTDMSVEYDKPSFNMVKDIQAALTNLSANIQGTRDTDDTSAINYAGQAGLSFCLPTTGNIHSYKNEAKLSSIPEYYKGLVLLLSSLKKELEYKTFSGYSMNIALKSKNSEKFVKKLDKAAEKRKAKTNSSRYQSSLFDETGGWIDTDDHESNWVSNNNEHESWLGAFQEDKENEYNLTDFQLKSRNEFIDMILDHLNFQEKLSIAKTTQGRGFLETVVYEDRSFLISEFNENFDISQQKAIHILNGLATTGGVLIEDDDYEYKFPCPDFLDW